MSQHTPTPWTASDDASGRFSFIKGADGTTVINMSKKNAEFIVRAVNSHEALLRLAYHAYAALNGNEDKERVSLELGVFLREHEKAIAQAEARP